MGRIFVASDWHFCHDRDFVYKPRGFKNVNEMNEAIIKRHNSLVNDEDDVYCLGDCMLNDNAMGLDCLRRLKGKIHIIVGNHDTDERRKLYASCYNVVEVVDAARLRYHGYNLYLSHYPTLTGNHDNEKPLNRRCINLCGHYHTQNTWEDWALGTIYHCEMDAHNCYPVALDDILEELQKKDQ